MVSWRFTILLLGEIGRQLVKAPLAAALSPYFHISAVDWVVIHPTFGKAKHKKG